MIDDGEDSLEMGAGGDFRDDTTVSFENVDLGDDDIREKMLTIFENGGGGFVARRFDGEDAHD